MKALKWFGITILSMILILLATLAWLITARPDLSAYERFYAPPARGKVTVRFFGTSSMLFSDGETNVMIDGWFTRPSTVTTVLGKVAPDVAAIEGGLLRLGNPKIAALVATHSHLDHALDVAEVAKRTQALLVGSASTANIGRGGGLSERQIKVIKDGETLSFGDFTVTMIESRHFALPSTSILASIEESPAIETPVVPPASAFAYPGAEFYSIVIEHPAGSALIQSSPGFKEDALEGLDVDAVYLGVGFVGSHTTDYQDTWWHQIVTLRQAEGIYIMHWDSLSHPIADIDSRPVAPNRLWNDVFGMRSEVGIDYALDRAEKTGVHARLLPMWQAVDAFDVTSPSGTSTR